MDVKDPRFQAMFTSPLFNLDPTHPAYRNTRATQSILSEKQHRRQPEGRDPPPEGRGQRPEGRGQRGTTEARMDPSLSLLVKSIKNKTQEFQNRKKQKRSKV